MDKKSFSVASFNVRNLVNAKTNYYQNKKTGKWKSYSQGAFDRKVAWLAEQLYRMDTDFVCLQEVFHVEALQAVVDAHAQLVAERKSRQQIYLDIRFAANDRSKEQDPSPGLAFISKRPILDEIILQDFSDRPIQVEGDDGFSYQLTRASRPFHKLKVDLGHGIVGWIVNAHLKSKRPQLDEGSDAQDESNALFLERSFGVFRSLALRAGEALALRRELLELMTGSNTPVIAVGDLNDEIGAVSTNLVSGEAPYKNLEPDVKKLFWDVELYSAARTHLRRSEHASFFTHIYNGHYSTIDHIFFSQEFYYRSGARIGDLSYVECLNDHITDDSIRGAPGLGDASDHGQLVAKFSFKDEVIAAAAEPADTE